jgi:hypothetical protein
MAMDIYVCPICFSPVIFRGPRPPRVYHLGTGWYCWEKLQEELGEARTDAKLKDRPLWRFPKGKPTPRGKRGELRRRAAGLYRRYLDDGDPSPTLRFMRGQLNARRIDVVRDFLLYLAGQRDKKRNALLRRIVTAPSWQKFARGLKPLDKHPAASR